MSVEVMLKYNVTEISNKNICKENFLFFWKDGSYKSGLDKGCLSQWWSCKFKENKITFSSVEQYMMFKKAILFNDCVTANKILSYSDPKIIKALGREVKRYSQEVWDEHKVEIVKQGNVLKFTQNQDLREFLKATGDKILVEASPYDNIWGIGCNEEDKQAYFPNQWKGKNLLGFILMEVRDELREDDKGIDSKELDILMDKII